MREIAAMREEDGRGRHYGFVVASVFLLTCLLYVDRVGFALVYTEAVSRKTSSGDSPRFEKSVIEFNDASRRNGVEKGIVLGAFFYGYAFSQIPAGLVLPRVGGPAMLAFSCLSWTLISRQTAGAINADVEIVGEKDSVSSANMNMLSWFRLVAGIVQGLVVPSVHVVLATLLRNPEQRAVAVATSVSGFYFGSAATMAVVPSFLQKSGGDVFAPGEVFGVIALLPSLWLLYFSVGRLWLSAAERGQPRDVRDGGECREEVETELTNLKSSNNVIVEEFGESSHLGNAVSSGVTIGVSSNLEVPEQAEPNFGTRNCGPSASVSLQEDIVIIPSFRWDLILQSLAFWVIALNSFSFHYSFYVLINWFPTYMQDFIAARAMQSAPSSKVIAPALPFMSGSAIKAVPYLVLFFSSLCGGYLSDWLVSNPERLTRGGWWSLSSWVMNIEGSRTEGEDEDNEGHVLGHRVASARRAVNNVGFLVGGIFLVFASLFPSQALHSIVTDETVALVLISIALAGLGLSRGGFSVNHLDICDVHHAGLLISIVNAVGTLGGCVGVPLTGIFLDVAGGPAHQAGWVAALGIAALFCLGGAALFGRFAVGVKVIYVGAPTDS